MKPLSTKQFGLHGYCIPDIRHTEESREPTSLLHPVSSIQICARSIYKSQDRHNSWRRYMALGIISLPDTCRNGYGSDPDPRLHTECACL
ncbi:hypothetical protein ILYODFUR_007803 [Ilyodon furcidens]|uniref:Uncharacterized protein n=1 Tax=Ilyodon furcidens TaxID=33524 RepID=A0ABV0T7I6_9TELE